MSWAYSRPTLRLVTVFVLVGCGGSPKPTAEPAKPPTEGQVALVKLAEFRNAMCACQDPPCAKRVSDHLTAWMKAEGTKVDAPTMTEAEQRGVMDVATKIGECMQTAMGRGPAPGSAF